MNLNPLLMEINEITTFDIEPDWYTGSKSHYGYFKVSESPRMYAEDKAYAYQANVQVHLFAPHNFDYIATKKEIKKFLESNDFSGISFEIFFETETNLNHILIECSYSEEESED